MCFSCISFSLGFNALIAFIWRLCLIVRGTMRTRIATVKMMMAMPKLLKKT